MRRFLMKVTSWLQRDSYKSLVGRLRGLKLDYGRGFTSDLIQGPERSTLTIRSCFYRDIFDAEEVTQLTAACCCNQDKVWLEGAPREGVASGLESSMANGDQECCFYVEKM